MQQWGKHGLWLVLLLTLSGCVTPGSECGQGGEQQIANADAIFMGTVVAREMLHEYDQQSNVRCAAESDEDTSCGSKLVYVLLDRVWKGAISGPSVKLFVQDSCQCFGPNAYVGSKQLFFAKHTTRLIPGAPEYAAESRFCGTRSLTHFASDPTGDAMVKALDAYFKR